MDFQNHVDNLLRDLRSRGELPKKMDVTQVGQRYWFVGYDNKIDSIMSESSFAGFSDTPVIAMLKSLSERMERLAFGEGNIAGINACQTARSDGFAAYPRFYPDSSNKVRNSALAEAIERYVWSMWWDNDNYAHEVKNIEEVFNDKKILQYASEVEERCGLKNIQVIIPNIENSNGFQVFIFVGFFKNGGVISGGACGVKGFNDVETSLRALDELLRHGLAIKKIEKLSLKPDTFYEKRLVFFGSGLGNELVLKRLHSKGQKVIVLPDLLYDLEIPHRNSDLFVVHRCLFKDQPPFMGGAVERLCI